ncbi:hypothetical protein LguiB_018458 [Lonicera macranthoides]
MHVTFKERAMLHIFHDNKTISTNSTYQKMFYKYVSYIYFSQQIINWFYLIPFEKQNAM